MTDKDLKDKELKSSVSDVQKTMASKSDEFNDTIKTIEKAGTGVDIVGPENSNLTEQVQSTVTKENDGKPTSLKMEGSSGESGGGKFTIIREDGSTTTDFREIKAAKEAYQLNISKPKKTVSTTTITPERKSKNTVMIVGNKGGQSQSQGGMGSKSRTNIIVQKDNSIKDQFALSLF